MPRSKYLRSMSRYGRMRVSRIFCQMIRVISSPSISTTGFFTVILAIRTCAPGARVSAELRGKQNRNYTGLTAGVLPAASLLPEAGGGLPAAVCPPLVVRPAAGDARSHGTGALENQAERVAGAAPRLHGQIDLGDHRIGDVGADRRYELRRAGEARLAQQLGNTDALAIARV